MFLVFGYNVILVYLCIYFVYVLIIVKVDEWKLFLYGLCRGYIGWLLWDVVWFYWNVRGLLYFLILYLIFCEYIYL